MCDAAEWIHLDLLKGSSEHDNGLRLLQREVKFLVAEWLLAFHRLMEIWLERKGVFYRGVPSEESCFFGLCPSPNVSKNTTFRKLDLFPSSGKIMGARTLLGPLERANINHWTSSDENRSSFQNVVLETLDDSHGPKLWRGSGAQKSRCASYFTWGRKQIQFPKRVFRNIRQWTNSKNMIPRRLHHRQNLLEFIWSFLLFSTVNVWICMLFVKLLR
jgi:hypothetical protein